MAATGAPSLNETLVSLRAASTDGAQKERGSIERVHRACGSPGVLNVRALNHPFNENRSGRGGGCSDSSSDPIKAIGSERKEDCLAGELQGN